MQNLNELALGEISRQHAIPRDYIRARYLPDLAEGTVESYLRPKGNRSIGEATEKRIRSALANFIIDRPTFICESVKQRISALRFDLYDNRIGAIDLGAFDDYKPRFSREGAASHLADPDSVAAEDWDTFCAHLLTNGQADHAGSSESKRRQCVISGRPGMGKSMVLRKVYSVLADSCVAEARRQTAGNYAGPTALPLFVSLGDLGRDTRCRIDDLIDLFLEQQDVLDNSGMRVDVAEYLKRMDKSKLFFVLDGFDEAPINKRSALIHMLADFPSSYILSSRYVQQFDELNKADELHIYPLTLDQILQHIQRISNALELRDAHVDDRQRQRLNQLASFLKGDATSEVELSTDVQKTLVGIARGMGQKPEAFISGKRTPSEERQGRVGLLRDTDSGQPIIKAFKITRGDPALPLSIDSEEQRRQDLIVLLRTPLILNLALVAWIKGDSSTLSYEIIFHHYTQFLIGQWRLARQVVQARVRDDDSAYIACQIFLSIIAHLWLENISDTGQGKMSKAKLVEWAEPIVDDIINFGDERFEINDLFAMATTTGLILEETKVAGRTGAENIDVSFTPPGELFALYLAALIIQDNEHSLTRHKDKRLARFYDSIERDSILRDPLLRFKEDAIIFWSQLQANKTDVLPKQVRDKLIDTKNLAALALGGAAICDDNDAYEQAFDCIAPFNKILFVRVINSAQYLGRRYWQGHEREQEFRALAEMFDQTNFERVYRACEPIMRDHEAARSRSREGPEAWRFSQRWAELHEGFRKVIQDTNPESRLREARRIIYRIRYHAHDVVPAEAVDLIQRFLEEFSEGGERLDSVGLLCLNTLLRLKASADGMGVPLGAVTKCISTLQAKAAFGEITDYATRVSVACQRFADHPDREFHSLLSTVISGPETALVNLRSETPTDLFSASAIEVLARECTTRLQMFQEPAAEHDSGARLHRVEEALLLRFISSVARAPGLRRHFVCSTYGSLSESPSTVSQETKTALMKALIDGAALGINWNDRPQYFRHGRFKNLTSDAVNLRPFSVGGWQSYDFYAYAIWDICYHGDRFSFYQA